MGLCLVIMEGIQGALHLGSGGSRFEPLHLLGIFSHLIFQDFYIMLRALIIKSREVGNNNSIFKCVNSFSYFRIVQI